MRFDNLDAIEMVLVKENGPSQKDINDIRSELGYFGDSEQRSRLHKLHGDLPDDLTELDAELTEMNVIGGAALVLEAIFPIAGLLMGDSSGGSQHDWYRANRKELKAFRVLLRRYGEDAVMSWTLERFEAALILMIKYMGLRPDENDELPVLGATSPEGAPVPIPVQVNDDDG